MAGDLKPCPFCGVDLTVYDNPADLYVRRYGTHYQHPRSDCHLSDHEVTPSEVNDWNRRVTHGVGLPGGGRDAW